MHTLRVTTDLEVQKFKVAKVNVILRDYSIL